MTSNSLASMINFDPGSTDIENFPAASVLVKELPLKTSALITGFQSLSLTTEVITIDFSSWSLVLFGINNIAKLRKANMIEYFFFIC